MPPTVTCEICGHVQAVQRITDEWRCGACGQRYDYNNCTGIVLTDDQRAVLRCALRPKEVQNA